MSLNDFFMFAKRPYGRMSVIFGLSIDTYTE